mmetsp:Transcript_14366/g.39735  ORF Transcript_14366/g.39735 Transcript_14366/m.39735 type:complete len:247 (+) Transcript_14366:221-961(+)
MPPVRGAQRIATRVARPPPGAPQAPHAAREPPGGGPPRPRLPRESRADSAAGGDADMARLDGRSPRADTGPDGLGRGAAVADAVVAVGTELRTGCWMARVEPPSRARALCGASTATPALRRALSVDLARSRGVAGGRVLYVEEELVAVRIPSEAEPPTDPEGPLAAEVAVAERLAVAAEGAAVVGVPLATAVMAAPTLDPVLPAAPAPALVAEGGESFPKILCTRDPGVAADAFGRVYGVVVELMG